MGLNPVQTIQHNARLYINFLSRKRYGIRRRYDDLHIGSAVTGEQK
jgi:hypothetical protein